MHETTHSVFQALIGSILNQEILGLHEAFADYFSLSVIGSPDIGRIMAKGKALRTASKILQYKTGMEAHDLGNVVVAALWNIRQLFKDTLLADRIALETVRQVSLNPYASAGDVVTGYLSALAKLGQDELHSNPELQTKIEDIWQQTGLTPSSSAPNLSVISGALDDSHEISADVSTDIPKDLAKEFALPEHSQSVITLYEKRGGDSDDSTVWYRVGYGEGTEGSSFWIFYNKDVKSIYAAYDTSGNLITRDQTELFKQVQGIGDSLSTLLTLEGDFAKEVETLYNVNHSSSVLRLIYHAKGVKTYRTQTTINGSSVQMTENRRGIRPTILSAIIGTLDKADLGAVLKAVSSVSLYTVPAGTLNANRKLVDMDGNPIVGFTEVTGTGATQRLILRTVR
jgi:hypothetical protein